MYLLPDNNTWCCGEKLSNAFWAQARAYPDRSDPLGWALAQAKRHYAIGGDVDRKTVQTFTYFGLPWMRLPGHATGLTKASTSHERVMTSPSWSPPALTSNVQVGGLTGLNATYVVTANVDASVYAISNTAEGFDLIDVDTLLQRTEHGQVVLPRASLNVVLPLSATVTNLVFTPTQDIVLSDMDIPMAQAGVGVSGGPTGGYTTTVDGIYPVTATFESKVVGSYQRVRVHVVPVTYDAANDQATLYRSVDVALEYDTPEPLALTDFELNEIQYLPGETISATARLVNAGSVTETITATLVLQDAQGQIVGFKGSGAVDVPANGTYDLALGWNGPLSRDTYLARILIWQGGRILAGSGSWLLITDGEIASVSVPDTLFPGQQGVFQVDFDNLGASTTIALASMAVYDQEDGLAAFLPSQIKAVPGGQSADLTFTWSPDQPGAYTALFTLIANGQAYGPVRYNFGTGYQVYLPLALRES
jgi:hypothetical protein